MADLMGKTIGRYRVVAKLGRGGMAEVYKGYQPSLDRYVALKVLLSHLVDDKDFLTRFEREALNTSKLSHPNIVKILDFDTEHGNYFMVMDYINGPTLKDELKARKAMGKSFDLKEIGRIFTALGSAVDYAHARKMIHRDIKPANIMINQEGHVVLADFGIMRTMGNDRHTATGALAGTPAYMAPEQGKGIGADERSDIYALGVVLYELVTGQVPYDADTPYAVIMQHIREPLTLPTKINPHIPKVVEKVVLKALRKEPDDRYQTASEMAKDLREAVGLTYNELNKPLIPLASPPQTQEVDPFTITNHENTGVDVNSPNFSLSASTAPSDTNSSSTNISILNWTAILLIGGAIGLISLSINHVIDVNEATSQFTTWVIENWPWAILVIGITIAVAANYQKFSQGLLNIRNIYPSFRKTRLVMPPLSAPDVVIQEDANNNLDPQRKEEAIDVHNSKEGQDDNDASHLTDDDDTYYLLTEDIIDKPNVIETQDNEELSALKNDERANKDEIQTITDNESTVLTKNIVDKVHITETQDNEELSVLNNDERANKDEPQIVITDEYNSGFYIPPQPYLKDGVIIIQPFQEIMRVEDSKQPAIRFRRELDVFLSEQSNHLIENWLHWQDSKPLSHILKEKTSARLLLTGFGSFGGTVMLRLELE